MIKTPKFLDWVKTHFIGPLLDHMPPQMQMSEFLRAVFRTDYRRIDDFVSLKELTMIGKYLEHGMHPVSGWRQRTFKAGTLMLIRDDSKDTFVDVQVKEEVFRLDRKRYEETYRRFLKPVRVPVEKRKR